MDKTLDQENIELKKELERYKDLLAKEEIDEVTGLYSKNMFFSKAKELLVENPKTKFVFVIANIDKFQLINSFFGFDEGDALLKYVSFRLKQVSLVVPKSVVGHLGADSFVICCTDLPNNGVLPLLEKTIHSIIVGYRDDFKLSISVGIYHIEDNTMNFSLIRSRATVALKKSKEEYGEFYTVYNKTMDEDSFQNHFVINELQTAFAEKQFEVYLQPKCNLSNGKVIGAEALVRWIHPEKGIIGPDHFIPILETNGFVTKLDEYVWDVACKYIRSWIDSGLGPLPISVNVSRVDLHNPELSDSLLRMLEDNGVDIDYLHLEITESAYSENPYQIIDVVNNLHALGFYIELDDFGTGYSSLNMLNAMKLHTLKLDMSFIKAQTENKKTGEIINFIVRLAKQLNLLVVAEGIETSEQLAFLRGIGCEIGQGYYFSKALSKIEFDEYMRNHTKDTNEIVPLNHRFLLDVDDIWYPNSKFNFIFNHFVGALALYEVKDNTISLLRTNDEFFNVLNYSLEDVVSFRDDVTKSIHSDDIAAIASLLQKFQTVGSSSCINIRAKTLKKKNEYMWIKMQGKIVAVEKDTTIILASLENIDKEHKAIDKLQKAAHKQLELNKQLSIYKNSGGDGVFIAKVKDGLILEYANEEFYKIHDITKAYALKNKNTILPSLIDDKDKERIMSFIFKCIEKKAENFEARFTIISKKKPSPTLFARGKIKYTSKHPVVEVVIHENNDEDTKGKKRILTSF